MHSSCFPQQLNLLIFLVFLKVSASGPWPLNNSSSKSFRVRNRVSSVTSAISMFYNSKVTKVLRELFAFIHHDMFLLRQLGKKTPFYRTSVGPEPADINLHGRIASNS